MRTILTCGFLFLAAVAVAAEPPKPGEKINYADHVRPIFREHCFNCHNQNKATNDLAVDSYERIRKGGASGETVQPGNLAESYLWLVVNHESEPHMPPMQDKLAAAKLDIIKRWIAEGALKDSGSKAEVKKPTVSLTMSTGAAKPSGPPIMPEGLSRQPVAYTPRPAAVTAIAAAPWAPLVAIAGQKQIALYHSDSGELLGILPFPEGIPYSLRFSRSGAILLAGGGQNARRGLAVAYDVKTGKRLFDVGDELDVVLAADISADHSHVAVGGPERIVKVFNTSDGSMAYELRKHTDWIYAVEFSPDGVLLASGDRSGGLLVWESDTGREYQNLDGHKVGVTSISFRDDSNLLASGSEDGTVKYWNMEDGKQVKNFGAHGPGVTSIQFTHDGRLASCGRDRIAKLFGPEGQQLRAFEPLPELALRVALTHDGGRVIAGDWTGEIREWNSADGKQLFPLPSNPPTLAMQLESAQAKAATAQAAAQKAEAEMNEANAKLADAKKALEAANKDSKEKPKADLLRAEIPKLEKVQAERAAALKAAQEAASAAKTTAEKLTAEKAAAEQGKKP